MNNKLLFYVDTDLLDEGNIEYTIVKLLLESGDTNAETKIKGKTISECNEKLHKQILRERPQQIIFERTGWAAPLKDSYLDYLSQHLGDVLMDQAGNLYYRDLVSQEGSQNTKTKPDRLVSFSKNVNIGDFKLDNHSLPDLSIIIEKLGIQFESLTTLSSLNSAKAKASLNLTDGVEEFKNLLDQIYKLNMWVLANPPVK
ncbi:hypothetical protein [Paenibacillus sp. LK1]|uniref:hypothetical protein n=1 Tax=Paenibacillus sp. LK1 TaxID=2053014 RepID=UPI000C178B45|nr:hypothetical protein [Paenibacillus sp. LK1]PIH61527.1 hypothetical protein CS562_03725 [Paenibacillus sp. LK1]